MESAFREAICKALGADELVEIGAVQSLWSGYGRIARFAARGGSVASVVVKIVRTGGGIARVGEVSHSRKVRSYEVESIWYERYAHLCGELCRVPRLVASVGTGGDRAIALEDLDLAGYPVRKSAASMDEMKSCLSWLANFHATFLGVEPVGLWSQGTYWHLGTRPDELEALVDLPLKAAAGLIDAALENCRFKTLVHGDAKLANFCFSENGIGVAAVDFQYVGGGCGMKDVAYFIGSCLSDSECERQEACLLDLYFECLAAALARAGRDEAYREIASEWRKLFPVAWADFHRFLKGWNPGHWKLHSYSERIARGVVRSLVG